MNKGRGIGGENDILFTRGLMKIKLKLSVLTLKSLV
jgi:hypothetical protein